MTPERVRTPLLRALDPSRPVTDLPTTAEEQAGACQEVMSRLAQASRPVLLVLDNAGGADQVSGLLPPGRSHRVLITSRRSLPELPGARSLEIGVLAPAAAVASLGARRPGDPRLSADPATAAALARLCGNLPVTSQTTAVLIADDPARSITDLVKALTTDTSRSPDAAVQRWPGQGAIELAYRHLDNTSARLFRLLAIAPGADIAAPAAAALADQPIERTHQHRAALTRAQLLECQQPGRWHMHGLVRSCVAGLATTDPEDHDRAIIRLLEHYRDTTYAATRRWSALASQQTSSGFDTVEQAVDWLNAERANLIAALSRAATVPTHRRHAIDIALGLAQFLDRERYLQDWIATATIAVHAATGLGDDHREAALNNLGSAHAATRRCDQAIISYHHAADIYRELIDHHGEGKALNNLGSALAELGRFEESVTSHGEAANRYHQLGDRHGEGRALGNLGLALIQLRQLADAREALERASALFVSLRAYDDADRVVALLTTLND